MMTNHINYGTSAHSNFSILGLEVKEDIKMFLLCNNENQQSSAHIIGKN